MKQCPGCDYNSSVGSYCPHCGKPLQEPTGPVRKTIYLNGEMDGNYSMAEEIGLSGKTVEKFAYTLMELGVVVDIDLMTGEAVMVGILDDDNRLVELEQPVKVN